MDKFANAAWRIGVDVPSLWPPARRSPSMESTSTGAFRARSRYMEEVNDEPAAVNSASFSSRNLGDGGYPQAAATAAHSLRAESDKSAPPGIATISPIFPRSRQVMA